MAVTQGEPRTDLEQILREEKEFLNKVYKEYSLHDDPQTKVMRRLAFDTMRPYLRKDSLALELGCSDGYFTEMLAAQVGHLDVLDGSINFIREAQKRAIPNVVYHHALFEEYRSEATYDFVFASYILEHVLEPGLVLDMVRRVLKPDGLLFIVVPNARALSRQLALHMGLYTDLKQLTENDLKFGHRRVYDRVCLNRDTAQAGFETIHQCGILLKILADFQMNKLLDTGILQEPQIAGLYRLGMEYPDLCGSLFSVCRPRA